MLFLYRLRHTRVPNHCAEALGGMPDVRILERFQVVLFGAVLLKAQSLIAHRITKMSVGNDGDLVSALAQMPTQPDKGVRIAGAAKRHQQKLGHPVYSNIHPYLA